MKSAYRFLICGLIVWGGSLVVFTTYIIFSECQYDNVVFENIVALTGEQDRMLNVPRLAEIHKTKNAFISGVYEKTTLEDIFSKKEMKNVRVILGKKARNTKENALEIRAWAEKNSVSEILLITSDYHIPRSLAELKSACKSLKIFPCAIKSHFNLRFVWRCVKEFHKTICVCVRILFENIRSRPC
jgi:uncharacterized SAM-binding protein YcdF (DUF218 family)